MDIKVNVPESLGDIILSDYQKFLKIESENDNREFVLQKMIEIFCHLPGSVVIKMKHGDFNSIASHLMAILKEQPPLKERFKMGGVEYGFIPNMSNDIEFGEYIDLDNFMTSTDNLHKTMGVLYRPVTSKKKVFKKTWDRVRHWMGEEVKYDIKYQIEEYDAGKYDEVMKNAPMDVVIGALLFFYRLSNQLLRITPKYLQRLVERNQKAVDLVKNGDGTSTYISSLEETSSNLIMFLNENLARHCFSLRTIGTITTK